MNNRGEYRAIYTAFRDDPDVHRLSDRAHRVLLTLKLTLPAIGIGVVYPLQLSEQCNCTVKQLDAALAELETPKPGEAYGWIAREKNIVWIVNGLRYEPTLSADNVKKHRPFVHRLLAQLGERPAIVARFKAYYAEWFGKPIGRDSDRASVGNRMADDTLSEGYAKGIDSLSEGHGKGIETLTLPSHTVPSHPSLSSPLGGELRPAPHPTAPARESEAVRRIRTPTPAPIPAPAATGARPRAVVPRPLAHLTAQQLSTRDDFLALGEKAARTAERKNARAAAAVGNGAHPDPAGGDVA